MKNLNTYQIIKRILLISSIPLLVATIIGVNMYSGKQVCKNYTIEITNADKVNFVSKQDIVNALIENNDIRIGSTLVKDISPKKLEQIALSNKWINKAEVYFSGTTLNIVITQKEPVVRLIQGDVTNEYYAADGTVIPVSAEHSANVPVFTSPRLLGDSKSKKLKQAILALGTYISNDTFWNAMVAQVDVNAQSEFDVVPQVGSQIIHFGNADMIEDKFGRLFKFYQEVLPKVGWQRYTAINVKYKRQIVGSLVDSLAKITLSKHVDSIEKKPIEHTVAEQTMGVHTVATKITEHVMPKTENKPKDITKKPTVVVAKANKQNQPTAQTTYTVNKKPSETTVAKSQVASMPSTVKKITTTQKPNVKLIDEKKEKQHKTELPKPKTTKTQNIKDEYQ